MPNNNYEYRSSTWESGKNETISGYALVFNQRTVLYKDPETGIESGEMIDPHSLDGADLSDVVLRYNHDGRVLARTRNGSLKLTVDNRGLKIDADLSGSDEAKSFYTEIKNGLLDKMSFAFIVAKDGDLWEQKSHTRIIKKIEKILDVSIVDFPAYSQTEVHCRSLNDAKVRISDEIRQARIKTIKGICKTTDRILYDMGLSEDDVLCYRSVEEFSNSGETITDEREPIKRRIAESRSMLNSCLIDANTTLANECLEEIRRAENELISIEARKRNIRQQVANGLEKSITLEKRGNNTMENSSKTYIDELIEKRSASAVSGMGNVIPADIVGKHIREGRNGLFDYISYSAIAHAGNIKVPYIADSDLTVNQHTENADITVAGNVPSAVTITHAEYECTLGYSYLGKVLACEQFESIINDALIAAMRKKLDSVAVASVKALTWTKTSGTSQNAVQWATSGSPKLSEIMSLMKLLPQCYATDGKLIMNRATMLSIIENSTGLCSTTASNNMYNVDITSGLNTLLGVPIVIDSNMSNGDILYGNPEACHLNVAGDFLLNDWLDHDSLTEKMQICCSAGAGTEVGSFVLGANSIS